MQMRPSRVLRKLRAGEIVKSIKLNLFDPRVSEIAAMCGCDVVWLDMEHVPNDWSAIEHQIRAAKVYDVDTLVRVARGSYCDYIRPLEMDATGLMVPHVMSLDDAKLVVKMTRFHPIGRRSADGGNADGAYVMIPHKEYIETANRERFIILQIEDVEPLDDLEEIAKLEGFDMLFFGPGDFSHSIGSPGQIDHPKVVETKKLIAKVARDNGKFAGTVCPPEKVQEFIDMGYQYLNLGADVTGLSKHFKEILAVASKANKSTIY